MTDEQILKRLAEIEGKKQTVSEYETKVETCARKGIPSWTEDDEKKWEAEGWEYCDELFWRDDYTDNYTWRRKLSEPRVYWLWNPLERWEDCGPLVEKYQVDTMWNPSDLNAWDEERGLIWEAEIHDYSDPKEYKWVCSAQDPDLKRAICLSVIEANGG